MMDSRIINGPLYTVPDTFAKRFLKEFPDYRIRWSYKKACWQIEQKFGREVLPPFRIDPYDDSLIRSRDGYWLVMEIQPGDRMACPTVVERFPQIQRCGLDIKVPVRHTAETVCQSCKQHGRDGRTTASYWPFDETFLEHMRRTDPLRDGIRRIRAEADAHNQRMEDTADRDHSTYNQAVGAEYFNRLYNINQWGYTGSNRFLHRDKGLK